MGFFDKTTQDDAFFFRSSQVLLNRMGMAQKSIALSIICKDKLMPAD